MFHKSGDAQVIGTPIDTKKYEEDTKNVKTPKKEDKEDRKEEK